MRTLSIAVAVLLPTVLYGNAQPPPQIEVDSGYSAEQLTVVPVLHSPLRDTVRADEIEWRAMTSRQRREQRAARYKFYVDSLVQSRDYVFRPESMQNAAGSMLREIYAEYFYLGLFSATAEVHLPLQRVDNYITVANFDSAVTSYDEQLTADGVWNISYNLRYEGVLWGVHLSVSDITGHVALTLTTPQMTMLYNGTIGSRRTANARH